MGEQVSIEKSTWVQIRDYFSDVRTEMKRVTWPSKQEIYGTTVMVLITTFLFGFISGFATRHLWLLFPGYCGTSCMAGRGFTATAFDIGGPRSGWREAAESGPI